MIASQPSFPPELCKLLVGSAPTGKVACLRVRHPTIDRGPLREDHPSRLDMFARTDACRARLGVRIQQL